MSQLKMEKIAPSALINENLSGGCAQTKRACALFLTLVHVSKSEKRFLFEYF